MLFTPYIVYAFINFIGIPFPTLFVIIYDVEIEVNIMNFNSFSVDKCFLFILFKLCFFDCMKKSGLTRPLLDC